VGTIGKYVMERLWIRPGQVCLCVVIGVFMLWLGWFGFNGGLGGFCRSGLIVFLCFGDYFRLAAVLGIGGFFCGNIVFSTIDVGYDAE